MLITSSNNLAVNNSLTVNGNSIFGADNTSTIICNSKPTFNSDVTVSGNINQTSGTFSTSSGNVNLNGDVVINGTKKLTSGTGDTTINGLLKCNGTINNVGLLASSGSFELGPTTGTNFTYIDVKTTGGNGDYDARIGVTGGSSSTFGQGALSFNCASCAIAAPLTVNGITNNNTLTQTGTATCNGINSTSINNSGNLTVSGTSSLGILNASSLNNSGNLSVSGTSTLGALNTSSINNSGSYNAISCTSLTDSGNLTVSGTSTLAGVNCSSINNSGILSTSNIELSSSSSPAYIDMKTTSGNSDLDVRLACNNGSSGSPGAGTLTITAGNTIINSPLSANSGTFSGITNNTNTLTNNGQLTQVGLANFSNNINLSSGQSVYITDAGITNYLWMHNSGTTSVIDFTGNLSFRNNGSNTNLLINSSTNQATFGYNLNTTGITNSTNAFTNNAVLNQNNSSNFSTTITAPSIISNSTFYAGSANNFDATAILNPKVINGIASGTADGASYTNFNLSINSWNGVGFVYSNPSAPSVCKLVINNRTGDLLTQGNITCNSININNNGELNSLYRNNIKNYNIRGYSTKTSGTNTYSWLLSSTQQTYTTNTTTLAIDSTCFSIQVLYIYYTTGTNLYQGATPYYIIKYGSGSWIANGGSVSNTQGAFQCQPLFNVSADNTTLNIYHSVATNNNDYIYFTYKVEMY